MTDFVVDPDGTARDVRTNANTPDASTSEPVNAALPHATDVTLPPAQRRLRSRNWLIAAVLACAAGEIGTGIWLSNRLNMIQQSEGKVQQAEVEASNRESQLDQRESLVRNVQQKQKEQQAELDQRAKDLQSEKDELQQRLLVLNRVGALLDHLRNLTEPFRWGNDPWMAEAAEPRTADAGPSSSAAHNAPDAEYLDRAQLIKRLQGRYEQVKKLQPTSEVEIAAREEVLRGLAETVQELTCRGSANAYSAEAELEFYIDLFKQLASVLGLSEDVVPRNRFELLDSDSLRRYELRQESRLTELRTRDAKAAGLFALAIEHEARVLADIREAKTKRLVDLTTEFAQCIISRKVDQRVLSLLEETDAACESQIRQRQGQLLATALALDHSNASAYALLRQLGAFADDAQASGVLQSLRQNDIIENARLRSAQSDISHDVATEQVESLIIARYVDPVHAARINALLRLRYEAETKKLSRGLFDDAFERWKLGHLTRGQLYELCATVVDPTVQYVRKLEAMSLPASLWLPIDAERAEMELRILKEELNNRPLDDPRPRLRPPHPFNGLSEVLSSSGQANSMDLNHIEYIELCQMLARTPGHQGTTQRLAVLAIEGLAQQLSRLESVKVGLMNAESRFSEAVDASGKPHDGEAISLSAIRRAKANLSRSFRAVEIAVDDLIGKTGDDRSETLLMERIRKDLAAIPSPGSSVKAAEPYADPDIHACLTDTEKITSAVKRRAFALRNVPTEEATQKTAEQMDKLHDLLRYDSRPLWLREKWPNAICIGTLSDHRTKVYYLGPQATPKDHIDENGVRYRRIGDRLCPN